MRETTAHSDASMLRLIFQRLRKSTAINSKPNIERYTRRSATASRIGMKEDVGAISKREENNPKDASRCSRRYRQASAPSAISATNPITAPRSNKVLEMGKSQSAD